MAQKIDGRLAYADLLRAFATLAVILLHLAGSQMGAVAAGSAAWRTFNLYDGLYAGVCRSLSCCRECLCWIQSGPFL